MPSHRTGPLKQQNKKHKSEKKKCVPSVGKQSKKPPKILNKRERRLMSKQRRLLNVATLKGLVQNRGDEDNPIWCTIIPLTPNVPVSLAKLLFRKCDAGSTCFEENALLNLSKIHFPCLNKYVCFMNANADDLFGTIDLALLADWVIIIVPSDFVELDTSTEALLSCLYGQGLGATVFAVMSPEGNIKQIKNALEARFSLPGDTVYPLNTSSHALNLLRHICSGPKGSAVRRAKDDPGNLHSATRFRAKLLASRIGVSDAKDSVRVFAPSDEFPTSPHLLVEGILRGAPLFFEDPLEQVAADGAGPVVHLSGWGDFPIRSASWCCGKNKKCCWSATTHQLCTTKQSTGRPNELGGASDDDDDMLDSDGSSSLDGAALSSDDDDGKDELDSEPVTSDHSGVVAQPMDVERGDESEEKQEEVDDDEVTSLSTFAARTMASSRGTAYSSAQLAKFRAARTEEIFPDEVETPPTVPAHMRFSKYRSLPRFQGSSWPVDSDNFPTQYENIACFKNYHRNRRSIIRYLKSRIRRTATRYNQCDTFIPPNAQVHFILGPMDPAVIRMILEKHTVPPVSPTGEGCRPSPLCLWSLLPHERRISVCHFTMHRVTSALRAASDLVAVATAANQIAERSSTMTADPLTFGEEASTRMELEDTEIRQALQKHQQQKSSKRRATSSDDPMLPPEAEPIRSKDLMLYQVGIRRFVAAPIYSTQTAHSSEKAKFEQFFPATDSTTVATVYAPVMYSPANVLQFRVRVDEDDEGNLGPPYLGELVATGTLHSVDPMRLIIKRIFLSGHPYKIHQRNAVVRFMFFNPTDVDYFKTVPLQTKTGAVGHIKEAVGTHGYMKCVFDRGLQASDVVLMPLYKRIFPKWVYQPIVDKALGKPVPVVVKEPYEWQEAPDTLQLTRSDNGIRGDEELAKKMSIFA